MNAGLKSLDGGFGYTTIKNTSDVYQMTTDVAVLDKVNNTNDVRIFENSEFGQLEVIMINDKPYFPATDCARILGYTNPQKAIRDHCKGVNETVTPINGINQTKNYIPEGDLYRLIIRSNLPSAERFEAWVMEEVLPSIRKHGAYMTPQTLIDMVRNPENLTTLLQALVQEQQQRIHAEGQRDKAYRYIEDVKPKVEFAEQVESLEGSVPMDIFAKIIQKRGLKIGRNRLFAWLRSNGYLTARNQPYQRYMDNYFITGFTVKRNRFFPYVQITGRGMIHVTNKLIDEQLGTLVDNSDMKSSVRKDIVLALDAMRHGGYEDGTGQ
jgi:anti-repressor protein